MDFEKLWQRLQHELTSGTVVSNWTAAKGYLGDSFTIVAVRDDRVAVDSPGAKNVQMVPRRDFEAVYEVWKDYLADRIPRYALRDLTRFSKYIISILHHLEAAEQQTGH
jgi:hypothetical protein